MSPRRRRDDPRWLEAAELAGLSATAERLAWTIDAEEAHRAALQKALRRAIRARVGVGWAVADELGLSRNYVYQCLAGHTYIGAAQLVRFARALIAVSERLRAGSDGGRAPGADA